MQSISACLWTTDLLQFHSVRLFVGGTIPEEFTEEEKKIITAVICKSYGNKTAANESDYIISDLAVIDSKGIPDIPTLLIISDGTITDGWIDFESSRKIKKKKRDIYYLHSETIFVKL